VGQDAILRAIANRAGELFTILDQVGQPSGLRPTSVRHCGLKLFQLFDHQIQTLPAPRYGDSPPSPLPVGQDAILRAIANRAGELFTIPDQVGQPSGCGGPQSATAV